MINSYQYGNTVRLECKFYDFENELVNPEIIKIIIYNSKYEVILNEFLNTNNSKGVGEYFYDYVTEKKEQKLYYEWFAEINGKPSIMRSQFITRFI